MRRRHKRRESDAPATSMITLQRFIDLSPSASTGENNTLLENTDIEGASNASGETTNRKIVSIRGTLMFASKLSAGSHAVAMFAMWAHPGIDDFPTLADFDPFDESGSDPQQPNYGGRPTPRPFGRKFFALATPQGGGEGEVIQQAFSYGTKAKRLLRPGWKLSAGLWVRASIGNVARCTGLVSVSVAG